MRINQFVALATGQSRRWADAAIAQQRVQVGTTMAHLGQSVPLAAQVTLDGQPLQLPSKLTIMLNKPVDYVCSRRGQGSQTIYDLLPAELHHLKPVGRLDKNSSGLLLLTNDGQLAQRLTHPSFGKTKQYELELDKPLTDVDQTAVQQGVRLEDGVSALQLQGQGRHWTVTMTEGRNRQIRRSFSALGYNVTSLQRTQFGTYQLGQLASGQYQMVG